MGLLHLIHCRFRCFSDPQSLEYDLAGSSSYSRKNAIPLRRVGDSVAKLTSTLYLICGRIWLNRSQSRIRKDAYVAQPYAQ